jgi:transcription initiation factor TFIIIB Brf1 subunit/transcription initiation factor TFIIB
MQDNIKKRAVRHKTPEWNRITLRVNTENKDYLNSICHSLNISQNLLINKIIDVFKGLDSNGKTLGKKMIVTSLKRDSDKYNVSQENSIEKTIKDLKEQLL